MMRRYSSSSFRVICFQNTLSQSPFLRLFISSIKCYVCSKVDRNLMNCRGLPLVILSNSSDRSKQGIKSQYLSDSL
ncbi:hypothetical protein FGO68_gene3991 [Halteria grandinella]|uniref:Uncharacterized protein n=1 Tax=Halteria grandinella TaxID=5974 RepID=A0A8J8SX20_HALGN|nr:hypothetical protein FGO68_gene3991 [Halteria grandinella]